MSASCYCPSRRRSDVPRQTDMADAAPLLASTSILVGVPLDHLAAGRRLPSRRNLGIAYGRLQCPRPDLYPSVCSLLSSRTEIQVYAEAGGGGNGTAPHLSVTLRLHDSQLTQGQLAPFPCLFLGCLNLWWADLWFRLGLETYMQNYNIIKSIL